MAAIEKITTSAAEADAESPVFLFSAGWRSGSTLLQRLLMSDPSILVWGEPYDESGLIQSLARTVIPFREEWPPPSFFYDGTKSDQLTGEWIATLFPDLDSLKCAHRAFMDTAFGAPARRAGNTRWGLKEVRLGVDHARYLRWLYPNARFLFLYRNPLDAYRSYCRFSRRWYDTWPDKPVFTPWAFGRHWHSLTAGYLRDAETLGGLIVRYEDLAQGSEKVLQGIEAHLGLRLNRAVLDNNVGSSERSGEKAWVSRLERLVLRLAVNPLATRLGYSS